MARLTEQEALSLLIEAVENDHAVYVGSAEAVARWKRLRVFAFNALGAEERGRRAEHKRAQSVIHVLHQCIRGKCDCGPGQFACEETARTVIDSWDRP